MFLSATFGDMKMKVFFEPLFFCDTSTASPLSATEDFITFYLSLLDHTWAFGYITFHYSIIFEVHFKCGMCFPLLKYFAFYSDCIFYINHIWSATKEFEFISFNWRKLMMEFFCYALRFEDHLKFPVLSSIYANI